MSDGATPPAGLIVVGASAGGVVALEELVGALPATLVCPLVVVLHLSALGRSVLPVILGRAGPLPARAIIDGRCARAGINVVPVDRHVLVTGDGFVLGHGPLEHGLRPAIDPTMRSAAAMHGTATIEVILSGTGHDGAAGLAAIGAAGGRTLVQDPEEARYRAMPEWAIAAQAPDAVLPVAGLAARLAAWEIRPSASWVRAIRTTIL